MAYRLKTVRAILTQAKRTDARKWAHRGSLAVPGVVWTVRDAKGCLVSQHYERPDDPPAIPTLVSHR
jgi:hypothetical protein